METMRSAVPFVPVIRPGKNEAAEAAAQLSAMITSNEAKGWRFCHLENVTTVRNNGCLASLAGNPTSTLSVQVAIFERDASVGGPV